MALMDGANRGTNEVRFTTIAIGTGHGPGGAGDDARTALRAQDGAAAAAAGTTMVAGRIALQAQFTRSVNTAITEVGVFARIGAGAEFLAAYWTDGGRVVATAIADQPIILAGVLDLQAAAASVNVTLAPALTLPPPTRKFVDLTDTPAALVAGRYLRVNADADALEGQVPADLLSTLLGSVAAGRYLRTAVNGTTRSLEARTLEELAQDLMGLAITLHTFTSTAMLQANANPRRWLVVAWGGGGGGGAWWRRRSTDPAQSTARGGAGGETRISGTGVDIRAAGGAGGRSGWPRTQSQFSPPAVQYATVQSVAGGSVAGAAASGIAVPGAGAGGGEAGVIHSTDSNLQDMPPGPGSPAGLTLALATPTAAANYSITIGAGGAAGATTNPHSAGGAGGAGGAAILEFIP